MAEIRAGVTEYDPRGVWAMGNAPGGCMFGSGGAGVVDGAGPNNNAPNADNCMNCAQVVAAYGDSTGNNLAQAGMSCFPGDIQNDQQTARSLHSKGVNVCLCDGSARFISDFIWVLPSSFPPGGTYSVWDRLIVSGDGQQIPANSF